jgi:hypothetical protein
MRKCAFLAFAAPVLALCAQTSSIVSLDGSDWLLAPDARNVGWTEKWFRQPRAEAVKTRVPWVIQDAFPGYHGVAWYWREFTVPVNPHPGGRYLLRFWAVNYRGDVWVNGRYAGGHEGGEMPFTLDVTDMLHANQSNRLAVRVVDPRYDAAIDGINRYEAPRRGGPAMQHGGIEDSVELIVAPSARLADVYVKADPVSGSVEIEATVENSAGQPIEGALALAISRNKQGTSIDAKRVPLVLTPGSSSVTAQLNVKDPQLWSIETPNLYYVTASLQVTQPGPSNDEVIVRTGFRDFRFEDGAFQLNGKKVLLRSAPQSNYDPIGYWLPFDHGASPDLFQRRLAYAKEMGFNMVRVHRAAARRNMLDFADENGILIYEECFASSRFSASPQQADFMRNAFRELVMRDRNHPSVVIWGVMNEIYAREPQFAGGVKALAVIRSLDTSRMVLLNSGRWDNRPSIGSISNPGSFEWQHLLGNESAALDVSNGKEDVGDVHHYVGFPLSQESINLFRKLGEHAAKPMLLSEFGVGSGVDLETLWEFFEKHRATHLESAQYTRRMLDLFTDDWKNYRLGEIFRGPKDFFRASMIRSARNRLDLINAVRSNPRIAGFSHVSLTERPMIGQGMITMYGELKPNVKEAMLDGLAPVRFCLFAEPRSLYKGDKVRLEAVLANAHALAPGEYAVQLDVRDGAGNIVWQRRAAVTVTKDGPLAQPVLKEEIALDGPAGEYEFLTRFADGRSAPGGSTKLHVFDKAAMPAIKHEVVLWAEDEVLQKWLTSNGIAWKRFDPAVQNQRQLIVVSDKAPAPGGRAAFEDLARRMARGSAVVFLSEKVFREGASSTRWLPLEQKGTILTTLNWLFGKDEWVKDHPIFDGLQRGGLMDYGFYQHLLLAKQPILTHAAVPGAAVAGGIATSSFQTELGVYHSGLMVAEYPFFAGRFLVNTLPVREAIGSSPQAERLLRNMLVYMSRDLNRKQSPLPQNLASALAKLYDKPQREAPRIDIVVPNDGAVIKAPGTVAINIRTAQVDTKVTKVEFFSNGALIGTDSKRKPDPSSYWLIWSEVPKGNYEVRAESVNEQGTRSSSQTVRVRVE